ncbi:MAG: hypothetical protein JW864_12365 [Spirochaetes bacterium]|nr:hypothetical protein [Spirochaetota bacterium]
MNELLLATFANKLYRENLTLKDFNLSEIDQPLPDQLPGSIKKFKGIAIIEVIEDSLDRLDDLIVSLNKNSVRIIALAVRMNERFRNFFLKHGIAEVLDSKNADSVINYIDITNTNINKKYGKILILEDNVRSVNILTTIISRFNYNPVIVKTVDDFFEKVNETNIQLAFVSLGTADFDITFFLRKALSFEINRKMPVIPYKDMLQGVFIHEMISGLNKIAKVFLSSEEVYSFLIDLLFRKELSPGLNLLNETLDFKNINRFVSDTLSRIYNVMGIDVFKMNKIITKEKIDIINGRIESLKGLILKTDGLKWLIKDEVKV